MQVKSGAVAESGDEERDVLTMKIIIAGSREFSDYELLKNKMNEFTVGLKGITVVSGGAKGADKLGERWAREHGHDCYVYKADWIQYGKSAGFIRNKAMIEVGDMVVAFWDGKSPGTLHTIELARKNGLKVQVVLFECGK